MIGKVITPAKVVYARVPKLLKVASLFYKISGQAPLSDDLKTMINAMVSDLNGCAFCIDITQAYAMRKGTSMKKLGELHNFTTSELFSPAEQACLAYVKEVTLRKQVPDAGTFFLSNPLWNDLLSCLEIMPMMTHQQMINFKTSLKKIGELLIKERITTAKLAIDNAQEAANNEGKSSAGDKYETGRAMGHLEKDMYARQQAENIKELDLLQRINADIIYTSAQTGAYVRCSDHSFFIAVGLGKQQADDQLIFFLSPYAPLAKLLLHKKAGDRFLFNKNETVILEIF